MGNIILKYNKLKTSSYENKIHHLNNLYMNIIKENLQNTNNKNTNKDTNKNTNKNTNKEIYKDTNEDTNEDYYENHMDYCYECECVIIIGVINHCNKCNKCHNKFKQLYCELCNICIDPYNDSDIIQHRKICKFFKL